MVPVQGMWDDFCCWKMRHLAMAVARSALVYESRGFGTYALSLSPSYSFLVLIVLKAKAGDGQVITSTWTFTATHMWLLSGGVNMRYKILTWSSPQHYPHAVNPNILVPDSPVFPCVSDQPTSPLTTDCEFVYTNCHRTTFLCKWMTKCVIKDLPILRIIYHAHLAGQ